MTYSRHQLKEALESAITASGVEASYKIVPDPRALGEFDPSFDAVLQIVRQVVKRNAPNPAGAFEESIELWLLVDNPDPEVAEDLLDDRLREVFDLLERQELASVVGSAVVAERGIHRDGNKHAYKFTFKITTDRTEE